MSVIYQFENQGLIHLYSLTDLVFYNYCLWIEWFMIHYFGCSYFLFTYWPWKFFSLDCIQSCSWKIIQHFVNCEDNESVHILSWTILRKRSQGTGVKRGIKRKIHDDYKEIMRTYKRKKWSTHTMQVPFYECYASLYLSCHEKQDDWPRWYESLVDTELPSKYCKRYAGENHIQSCRFNSQGKEQTVKGSVPVVLLHFMCNNDVDDTNKWNNSCWKFLV